MFRSGVIFRCILNILPDSVPRILQLLNNFFVSVEERLDVFRLLDLWRVEIGVKRFIAVRNITHTKLHINMTPVLIIFSYSTYNAIKEAVRVKFFPRVI